MEYNIRKCFRCNKFINRSVGADYKISRKMNNIFMVSYGGRGLPKSMLHALYSGSETYLDRKKQLANKLIFEATK